MFKLLDKGDDALLWFFTGPYKIMMPFLQSVRNTPIEIVVALLCH